MRYDFAGQTPGIHCARLMLPFKGVSTSLKGGANALHQCFITFRGYGNPVALIALCLAPKADL
jgi:hypothetical protein